MAALGMGHLNPLANEIFDLTDTKDMKMTDPEWMPLYQTFANRVLVVLGLTALVTIVEETLVGLLFDSLMTSLGLFLVSLHAMATSASPLCTTAPYSRLYAYALNLIGFSFPRVIRLFRGQEAEYLMLNITSILAGALSFSLMYYVMEKIGERQIVQYHADVQHHKQFLMKLFGTTPFYMLQAFSILGARTQAVFHYRAYCEMLPGAFFFPLSDWKGVDEVGNCSSGVELIAERLPDDGLPRLRLELAWQKFHRSELLWFTRTVIGAEMFYLFWTAMLLGPSFARRWRQTKEYLVIKRSTRLISEQYRLDDEPSSYKASMRSSQTSPSRSGTGTTRKMRFHWGDRLICLFTLIRFGVAVTIGIYDWSGAAYALHLLLTCYGILVVVACLVLAIAAKRAVAKAVRDRERLDGSSELKRFKSIASVGLAVRNKVRFRNRAQGTMIGRSESEEELDLEQSVPLTLLSPSDRWKWAVSKIAAERKVRHTNGDDEEAADDDGGCDDGGGGD